MDSKDIEGLVEEARSRSDWLGEALTKVRHEFNEHGQAAQSRIEFLYQEADFANSLLPRLAAALTTILAERDASDRALLLMHEDGWRTSGRAATALNTAIAAARSRNLLPSHSGNPPQTKDDV